MMMVLVPVALLASHPLMASLGRTTNSNDDWQVFHRYIVETEKLSPSVIVTPNWPTGGNLRFLFQDVPVATNIYNDYDPAFTLSDEHPAIMVWKGDDDQIPMLTQWLEGQMNIKLKTVQRSTLDIPMYYPVEGKTLRISYAIIRPADIEH
jgi:hypothetical protein